MTLVRIRRDGNSLAITIPREELRKAQLTEGEYVNVEADEVSGRVVIEPVSIRPRNRVRAEVLAAGHRVIAEERGLLDRLEAFDRGDTPDA